MNDNQPPNRDVHQSAQDGAGVTNGEPIDNNDGANDSEDDSNEQGGKASSHPNQNDPPSRLVSLRYIPQSNIDFQPVSAADANTFRSIIRNIRIVAEEGNSRFGGITTKATTHQIPHCSCRYREAAIIRYANDVDRVLVSCDEGALLFLS